jgi:hypothetical protein
VKEHLAVTTPPAGMNGPAVSYARHPKSVREHRASSAERFGKYMYSH